jgi:hypothetical protein
MPDDAARQHIHPSHVVPTRQIALAAIPLLLLPLILRAGDTRPAPATTRATTRPFPTSPAARVVQQFRDLLQSNRHPDAAALLADSPKPVRDADRRLKRLAAALAGGSWDFAVVDAKDSGDLAVVIINEQLKDGRKTIDLQPWFLIRQAGQWKLLAKYTDFELKEYGFDEPTLAKYRGLEEWAHRREPDLRRELPDCGC